MDVMNFIAEHLLKIASESWTVLGQMSPYLLFGFLAAGILSVCVSPSLVERHLGHQGFWSVLKASLFGIPLPLCSCSVIPVAASLRRHGASRGATASFLLSTPQTGVDSIAVTYALLGTAFAVFRPLAALVTGILGGLLVLLLAPANGGDNEPEPSTCSESCCIGEESTGILRRVLHYGFVTLPRDIGLPLLIGVIIAGAVSALAPADQWKPYLGDGVLSILLVMALGIPLYVCASASVPIAVGLIHLGASPGTALAFLIAGPASNAATLTTIWRLLGGRTAAVYLAAVALSALGSGLLLDWLMPTMPLALSQMTEHAHEAAGGSWLSASWAILLLAVVVFSYVYQFVSRTRHAGHAHADASQSPERLELAVGGMTCDHCEAAVTLALRACHGVASVEVDLPSGRAVVAGQQLQTEELLSAVRELGYQAEKADSSS